MSVPSGQIRLAPGHVVQERRDRVVVLGSVGQDSHSVGLIILRDALIEGGYQVNFLSIQQSLADFCVASQYADAVLVSNMDGHAELYLDKLPGALQSAGGRSAIWYLGGNPSLDKSAAAVERLEALGFDRIFIDYVSTDEVLRLLDLDLERRRRNYPSPSRQYVPLAQTVPAVSRGAAHFVEDRPGVLASWPTGAAAGDIEANAQRMRDGVSLSLAQGRRRAWPLIHPRCGVADAEAQRELFQQLLAAGADVLSFQIDSLTRNNCYSDVDRVVKSKGTSGSPLNGFPAVNHGASAISAIVSRFPDTPFQVRHSTRDPRLLAEVTFAGGVSAFEGGAICYNLPYYADYHPENAVECWRYVDQLAGHYNNAYGVIIDREFFGTLTGTLIPPSLAITVCTLEALSAASHGVGSVSIGYAEQGHRWQDVAAISCGRRLAREYLDRYGFEDVQVSTVFHQFMGAFPTDSKRARELIRASAVTAGLSGATRVMVKTSIEATSIPSAAENVEAIQLVKHAILNNAVAIDAAAVEREAGYILGEARSMIEGCLARGRGDFELAISAGVLEGLIDVPFSPSIWNKGAVRCARDLSGAVRYASAGALSIEPSLVDANKALVEQRLAVCGETIEAAIASDVMCIANATTFPLSERQ